MHYDNEKLEQALLAMLYIHHFDDGRVWKGYPFELMDIFYTAKVILITLPTKINLCI